MATKTICICDKCGKTFQPPDDAEKTLDDPNLKITDVEIKFIPRNEALNRIYRKMELCHGCEKEFRIVCKAFIEIDV